jgi:hypothetical protein
MYLPIILFAVALRCLTSYHIQFHPSLVTYIPFTASHNKSPASPITATREYGRQLQLIPLSYFLTVYRKSHIYPSNNFNFFILLILVCGDVQTNPGPINLNSSLCPSLPPPLLLPLLPQHLPMFHLLPLLLFLLWSLHTRAPQTKTHSSYSL